MQLYLICNEKLDDFFHWRYNAFGTLVLFLGMVLCKLHGKKKKKLVLIRSGLAVARFHALLSLKNLTSIQNLFVFLFSVSFSVSLLLPVGGGQCRIASKMITTYNSTVYSSPAVS